VAAMAELERARRIRSKVRRTGVTNTLPVGKLEDGKSYQNRLFLLWY